MKKHIQTKLEENNSLRHKDKFSKLREETKEVKSKDIYTWEDLEDYEEEETRLAKKAKVLTEKTDKLETLLKKKKHQLNALIK